MKHKQLTYLFLFALTLMSSWLAAQQISGTVTDAEGFPLIGATVAEVGTTSGTITDLDGGYTLTLTSATPSIKISYLGFLTQTVALDGRSG